MNMNWLMLVRVEQHNDSKILIKLWHLRNFASESLPTASSCGNASNARHNRAAERHWWNAKKLASAAPVDAIVRPASGHAELYASLLHFVSIATWFSTTFVVCDLSLLICPNYCFLYRSKAIV